MHFPLLRFSSVIAIIIVMSFRVVYATPPVSPYNLGETLSPDCAPGDVNCTVIPPQTHHNYLDDISAVTAVTGDLFYFNGTNWVDLAGGAVGQALITGAGGLPEWGSMTQSSPWQQVTNILSPVDSNTYRAKIENNSDNTLTGFQAVNTNDTHNYAGAVVEVKGSGPDYTNNMYFGKYSDNYYISSWAGNGVITTDQDLVLTSAGSTDATNPNPTPRILFQLGGGYTTPNNFMDLTPSGLAFMSGPRINSFLDEDNFASNSDTALATQQSIKSYVDTHVSKSLWDGDTDTGIQVEKSPDEDVIRFDTAGTERMNIKNTGTVDIGEDTFITSTPLLNIGDEKGLTDGILMNVFGNSGDSNGTIARFISEMGVIRLVSDYIGDDLGFAFYNPTTHNINYLIGGVKSANDFVYVGGTTTLIEPSNERVKVGGGVNVAPVSTLQVGLPFTEEPTDTPQYMQIDSIKGSPPPEDCDEDKEAGRMIYSLDKSYLYVCTGAAGGGWQHTALAP